MLYPVYIHKDGERAFGAIVPDMPGVHSAVDDLEDLPAALQEAVELMYEGEAQPPPRANIVDKYRRQQEFKGGVWMLVEIDLTKMNTRPAVEPGRQDRRRHQAAQEPAGVPRAGR